MATGIISLLEDPCRRRDMGSAARAAVRETSDWAAILPHMLSAWESFGIEARGIVARNLRLSAARHSVTPRQKARQAMLHSLARCLSHRPQQTCSSASSSFVPTIWATPC